jgi:hypothetical protein
MTATLDSKLRGLDLALGAVEPSPADATKPRESEDQDELWAFAIAETLLAELPRWRAGEAELEAEPRASAAARLLERAAAARSAAPASGATPAESSQTSTTSAVAAGAGEGPFERLTTELSDARLGRLELSVARSVSGLNIVINVADAHVKALIEADRGALLKSLQDCGLRVASVRVGHSESSGTELAREGTERGRPSPALTKQNVRWRAYRSSLDAENDAEDEGVDFTA